jgi:predicted lipoprotein with Yx(FWY)xxD motif
MQRGVPKQLARGATMLSAALLCCSMVSVFAAEKYRPPVGTLEDYQHVPMPPGFGVQYTDVEGPVFADSRGRTLYTWPLVTLRNGDAGEQPGAPTCEDTKSTESAGLMSPYPGGLILPDLESRPTCVQDWPPVYATADAKPVGDFTLVHRKDGRLQWAYQGYALYTSVLDTRPGQVNGGTTRGYKADAPAGRVPAGPPPVVPPAFMVRTHATGRIIDTTAGYSIYTWDGDALNRSNCNDRCLGGEWIPVGAGQTAVPVGEWGVIERTPGVKQWTFRGKPLYRRPLDRRLSSLEGSDVPGWHNVYTQRNPDPPAEFTVQDNRSGQVLADRHGKALYVYNCDDDSRDQLACDHPSTTQAYRLAVCGDGDPERCLSAWPYALAPLNAKSKSLVWGTAWVDAQTGHFARPNAPGAVHVWTFRDRPLYTFAKDEKPSDIEGDAWGEAWGNRNGFRALWLRDDYADATIAGGNAD